MAIEVTVEQVVAFGMLLVSGVGAYWKLKNKLDSHERKIKEEGEEIQKVWSKMLTINGHAQECTIMSLRVEKAIRDSGDEVQKKLEETIIDFQKEMKGQIAVVLAAVKSNGKISADG